MSKRDICPICNSETEYKYTGPSKRNGELDWFRCTNNKCNALSGKKSDSND